MTNRLFLLLVVLLSYSYQEYVYAHGNLELDKTKLAPTQTTRRAKLRDIGYSFEMTIDKDASGNYTITTQVVSYQSGDKPGLYLFDGASATSSNTFSIPNNGGKWWWVPFDENDQPRMATPGALGGGTYCSCQKNNPTDPAVSGGCETHHNGDFMWCENDDCTGCCDFDIQCAGIDPAGSGSGVFVCANIIDFNGVQYQ